ncbi:MAG: flavodoxin [Anaerovoracaceae bacterium]|jgi:menaquinone-dependent protoporphyrinogen IX oxidase
MKIRKLLSLVVTVCLVVSVLAACGSSSGAASQVIRPASHSGSNAVKAGNVLVVYYSATGRTKAVAEDIASGLDADVFVITPKDGYSKEDLDYRNENSRVCRERDNEALQDEVALETTRVENWDSYDTVFIGYPIWWGRAAWPVNQFVLKNDFTGKTVIPFCTSESSDIGSSALMLQKKAGTGTWLEGKRFPSGAGRNDAVEWARSMVK